MFILICYHFLCVKKNLKKRTVLLDMKIHPKRPFGSDNLSSDLINYINDCNHNSLVDSLVESIFSCTLRQ